MLSFVLDRDASEALLEGEVVVSAETALRPRPAFGWSAAEELLLYVIHGTLHLAGYDDARRGNATMRDRETDVWPGLGIEPHPVCVERRTSRCRMFGARASTY